MGRKPKDAPAVRDGGMDVRFGDGRGRPRATLEELWQSHKRLYSRWQAAKRNVTALRADNIRLR